MNDNSYVVLASRLLQDSSTTVCTNTIALS